MASRRQFVQAAGGLLVGFSMLDPDVLPRLSADPAPGHGPPPPERLDSWLRIEKDETVRILTGKVDIGMGVGTGLRQIVAEELDVDPERVLFVMGDTASTPDQGGVGGSTSIAQGAKPLRNAAASARFLLMELAARKFAVPATELQVVNGVVSVKDDSAKRVTYGALASDAGLNETLRVSGNGFAVNVEGAGKPKDPATYKIVGKSVPRIDLTPKIFGVATYINDVRLPGMVHARVTRPSSAGATLLSIDESTIKSIPGFRKVVAIHDFVAVVADTEWSAIRAAKELKVTWKNPGAILPGDLYSYMRAAPIKATREGINRGDVASAMASPSSQKLKATYEWPFQAHATMDPGCAVADFQAHGVTTVWCGAQKPHGLQKGLAQLLRVAEDQVRVIWVEDAGSYGRAGYEDVAGDAALLSQAIGKPVRVQWMRSDMTEWGGKGPAAVFELSAAFTNGRMQALQFASRVFSGTEILPQPNSAGNLLAGQLTGLANTGGGDEYSQWGDQTYPYAFANVGSVSHVLAPILVSASPLRTTHLRDPGGPAATFAAESFLDEIAALVQADPVEFRLAHLDDARMVEVLKAVAQHAKWERRPSIGARQPNAGVVSGRGVAISMRSGTRVATVAEVEVSQQTGAIRVTRLICAHDCGLIVNPEALRGTIAANLVQSLSRALFEEVTFSRERVSSVDWNSYRVARSGDIPAIEIVLINHPEAPPTGAGEPSTRPTAAAIANAIFDATGTRVRRAPFTAKTFNSARA